MATNAKLNYWNACPRKLDYFPTSPCHLGQKAAETKASEDGCPWYIASEEDRFCFWTWMRRVSDEEGFMRPLQQQEMTKLLCLSSSKINGIFKESLEKLKDCPEYADLQGLCGD